MSDIDYYVENQDGRFVVFDDGTMEEMTDEEQKERYGNVR